MKAPAPLFNQISLTAHIHHTAVIGSDVIIGDHVTIGPFVTIGNGVRLDKHVKIGAYSEIRRGCYVGAHTQLGSRCTLSENTTVGHNCQLKYGLVVTDTPNLSNNDQKTPSKIGDAVHTGANVTIMPGLVISDGATIGACSQVRKSLAPGAVVYGNPATEK